MMQFIFVLVVCFVCLSEAASAINDQIKELPGWNRELPSKQYSGFIDISGKTGVSPAKEMMIHYYYIESEGNPSSDPLVLFSNGGPGASSMFGLFTEFGPFQTTGQSVLTPEFNKTNIPTLFYNHNSWSKLGNLLVFDWPPPTGFSYCNGDPEGDGYSCGDWDDTRQAEVSFAALEGFFEKFPSLTTNGLYLTGESYAGVYIPKLAQQILEHKKDKQWNLNGIAVGDVCSGTEVECGNDSGFGPWFNYLFLYGHGQFSNKLWDELLATCGVDHLKYTYKDAINADACTAAMSKVSAQVGGYYIYNLYDDCTYQNSFRRRRRLLIGDVGDLDGAVNDYSCGGGDAQNVWTMDPNVRKAINVPLKSNFFSGDNAVGMNYELTEKNLMPFYEKMAKETDMRIIVYNGDTDPAINSFSAGNWTSSLKLKETKEWTPWTLDSCKRMGGYVTSYEGDFKFVTIRGSGHMVPTFKPEATFSMIESFLSGKSLKEYDASCENPS
jgi:carboxypeptidase C (cathepsin A)